MKKIEVKAIVYDRTTMEYVQKSISLPISEELAEMVSKEISKSFGNGFEVKGHGCGDNSNVKIPGIRTPLCSQKRFFIELQFNVIDEDGNKIGGWSGF